MCDNISRINISGITISRLLKPEFMTRRFATDLFMGATFFCSHVLGFMLGYSGLRGFDEKDFMMIAN